MIAVRAPAVAAGASCLDGFATISIERSDDRQARLADRNGDGTACCMILQGGDGMRSTVLVDNFIGDPNPLLVASCTAPFRSQDVGAVIIHWLPAEVLRQLSAAGANRDGALCVFIGIPSN
jgi:hypothetical protein